MRYVRMLTNALLGGLLGAAFVTILVLQLNRQIPLSWSTAAPLYGRLALFYAPHLTVLLYAMLIAREALARRPLSPGWLSIRILSWVGLLVVAAAAALMWANFVGYELALDDDSRRRLGAAAGATTLCAVLLLVIAIVHYSFGRRGSRVGATLLTLTLMASIGFPLTSRGWGDPRPLAARAIDLSPLAGAGLEGGHVTILAVDGASLDYIAQRVADGRLPAFGRLLEGGVSLYLETVRPTQPAPVWTSVAAGKYPPQTGVRAAARYEYGPPDGGIELLPDYCFSQALVHFGLLRAAAYHSSAVRARPLWTILSSQRVSAGVVGWPVTAPAAPMRGFLITDEFEPGVASGAAGGLAAFGAPADAVLRATAVAGGPLAVHAGSVEDPPLARDAWRREIAVQLRDEYRPRLLAVRYEGIDRAGHLYLQQARPRAFAGSGQDGEARLAAILDRHYAFLDAEIAQAAGHDGAGRRAAGRVRLRHGAGRARQAPAGPRPGPAGRARLARGRAGRLPAGLRRADAIGARAPGIRSSTSRPPSSTCSASPSRATWTASPAPTSSSPPSPPPAPSPSSPRTSGRAAPGQVPGRGPGRGRE